ncbi:MAG: GtrA family protein [Ruminococcaceae bacterium]|nr:GtrA family protein [Oscillospiraceae bacterium]
MGWTLFRKYREVILYLFFGGCTTLINIVVYALLYRGLQMANVPSTILAWLVSVIFAFLTNRSFVFESKETELRGRLRELLSFFGCRILTGILDVLIMALAVDMMGWNGLIWKIISNVIVIVLNYIASKFFIFRKQ